MNIETIAGEPEGNGPTQLGLLEIPHERPPASGPETLEQRTSGPILPINADENYSIAKDVIAGSFQQK